MKRLLALAACVLLLFTGAVFGASVGTSTYSEDDRYKAGPSGVRMVRHKFTMLSSTNGLVYNSASTVTLSGKIRSIYVDHAGTVTDNFDIMLVDADNKDWLYGEGMNFDSTNSDINNQRYPVTADTGATIHMPNINVYTSGRGFGSEKTVYFYLIEE